MSCYIFSLGPELISFLLSVLSVAYLIDFFQYEKFYHAILGFSFLLASYEIRPGNPFFLILFIIFVVYVELSKFDSNLGSSKQVFIVKNFSYFLIPISLIFVLPRLYLKMHAVDNSFHGGNFWGTIYGLVNPDAQSWADAYKDTAHLNFVSEIEMWAYINTLSIDIFLSNPTPAYGQALTNIKYFILGPPLDLGLGVSRFLATSSNFGEYAFFLLIFNSIVLFVYLLLTFYTLVIKSKANSTLSNILNMLVLYLFIYAIASSLVTYGFLFSHLKSGYIKWAFHYLDSWPCRYCRSFFG